MASKPELARKGTMAVTAKEGDKLLGSKRPDADAGTRGQSKKIAEIMSEKPSPKKAKLSKSGTMVGTAKEGKSLLGGEKLGDTRLVTKVKKARTSLKKTGSVARTIAESSWTTGTERIDVNAGRKLRKRKAVSYAPPVAKRSKSAGAKKSKKGK